VLSVIPNFNRALGQSIQRAMPQAKFVTLITDFADYPPHFWIERESEYLICWTDRGVAQAVALGHRREKVFRTSGMVLNPSFYDSPAVDRRAERQKLGLDPDLPTALVLFGGHGSQAMLTIAKRLQASPANMQMIFICGHNEKLAAKLRRIHAAKPMFVEGFTQRVSYYMSLADFFIGKPGPGSIAEALHFHLPVIVESNARTMPQERYNADWIRENHAGIVLKTFEEIEGATLQLLSGSLLDHLRTTLAAHENRAVYEAVEILKRIMSIRKDSCGPERNLELATR